jgi:hypothetical protein
MKFKFIGKKDLIVVNGGKTNLDINNEKRKIVLVYMLQFAQKYVNTK